MVFFYFYVITAYSRHENISDYFYSLKLGGGIFYFFLGTPPPGGRAGSEKDTLLPLTMTRDQQKFWNGPPSYRPETLVAEE